MKKIICFEGLRGYAIALVVISHLYPSLNFAGAAGVSLFLFLSGWLACLSSYNKIKKNTVTYFVHKIMRFYPLYFFVTLFTSSYFNASIVYQVSDRSEKVIRLLNYLMIQTWFQKIEFWGAYSQVGWYIPVVFLSIILTPIFTLLWKRLDVKAAILIIILVFFSNFGIILVLRKIINITWFIYVFPFWRMLDYFGGGCLYIISDKSNINSLKNNNFNLADYMCSVGLIIQIMFICISTKISSNIIIIFYTCTWILPSSLIILGLFNSNYVKKIFSNQYIVLLGEYSFEIFLTHLVVIHNVDVYGTFFSYDIGFICNILIIFSLAFTVKKIDLISRQLFSKLLSKFAHNSIYKYR